ncbi:sensor histidine kinase [Spirosoma endophyticum]|uniref:Histidine kinase n=1 Tax=Spirosoma endophyticum TaxID=662367 RepID=A0A1I1SH10_9BACT|nr:histidine kinase [Spirosoma endophyticum]SFD45755.1 Histidine kinase [Spirosoma endophyticum]
MKDYVKDKWLRIIGITLLVVVSVTIDDFYRQPLTGMVFVKFLIGAGTTIATWQLNRTIILQYKAAFPARSQVTKRLLLTFLSGALSTTFLSWFSNALEFLAIHGTLANYFGSHDGMSVTINNLTIKLSLYGFDFLHGIQYALFLLVVYGILFFVQDVSLNKHRLRQAEQEREELRAAHLQSQLDALKQHVNPHFLFNSLNSLSSLISEDPKQAERFVDKLSEVYRYLLRSNQQHLTTLDAELQFIDAYYHLLQTRYGAALHLDVAVNESYFSYQLPPLSLQLLVENAVKHNVASVKRPLYIQITVDQQAWLRVSNTLQRKTSRVLSNGVGLTNIVAKYQMLHLSQPIVEETDTQFTVVLPLLA